MAGITLAQAQAQLDLWLAASAAVAGNQSYSIKDRSLTRADAAQILRNVAYWNNMVARLGNTGRGRTRYIVQQ